MQDSFFGFDDVHNQARMLVDDERVSAYARAIAQVVKPGDVVADIGTGSGVLAVLALRAGARRVYAVERGGVADLAQRVFRDNDPEGKIRLLRVDAREAEFEEPPDVLLSETMGAFGIDEDMSQLYRVLLPRCAPEVRLIPSRLRLFAAAARHSGLERDLAYLDAFSGVELGAVRRRATNRPGALRVAPDQLLGRAQCIADLELRTSALPIAYSFCLEADRAGEMNVLCAWFEADLAPGVQLANSPLTPWTCWRHLCFPLDPPLNVVPGQALDVTLEPRISGTGSLWRWSVRSGSELRDGDVLASSGGNLGDFSLQLGLGLATGEERVPSGDLEVWAALLGGDASGTVEELTDRLLERLPLRFADRNDARDEVLRRLSFAGALR